MLDLAIKFLLTSLAVYRISRMLVMEDGPFDIFYRWKGWLLSLGHKHSNDVPRWRWDWVVAGFGCVHCVGFWIALLFTLPLFYWVYGVPLWTNALECAILWQALSGMTFVWKRLTE